MPIGPFPATGMNMGLPEDARALQLDQAARGGYQNGLGLTESAPPEIAASSPAAGQPSGEQSIQAPPVDPANAAAGGAQQQQPQPIEADEPLVDYKKDPLGAIGLLLSNVAAGMEGKELPTVTLADARQKHRLAKQRADAETIAARFQQAKLGMELGQAALAIGLKNPDNLDDFLNQGVFAKVPELKAVGLGVKNMIAARVDRMHERLAAVKATNSPEVYADALALAANNDIEGFEKFTSSLIEAKMRVRESSAVKREGFKAEDEFGRDPTSTAFAGSAGARLGEISTGPTPKERETYRSNLANESQARANLAESRRSSIAALNEQSAHNIAGETLGQAELNERSMSNIAAEERGTRQDTEAARHNIATEGLTGAGQTETARHNKATERADQLKVDMAGADAGRKNLAVAESYDSTLRSLDKLVGVKDPKTGVRTPHPGFRAAVGAPFATGTIYDWNLLWPTSGTERANFIKELDAFKAKSFLPMIDALRGTGAITDRDRDTLMNAVGALDISMGEKAFLESAEQIRANLEKARARIPGAEPRAGAGAEPTEAAPAGVSPEEWKYMTPEDRALWQNK